MTTNRGRTSLKCRNRHATAMQDYDRLPPELRAWLSEAILPWRAQSVRRAYAKARARTGCPDAALAELDRIQKAQVARDARVIWGPDHPSAV